MKLAESAHKNMVEALRESEQFRGRIIQSLMSGLYIYNLEKLQNDFISDQYTVLTGWTLDEINAMGQKFFKLFHPEERARVKEHFHNLQKMKDGEVLEIEYRFRTKDGRWIWCLSRDTVFERNEHGDTTRIIGSFFDITERRQAEIRIENTIRFQSLLSDVSMGFLSVPVEELDREIQTAQERFCNHFDFDLSSIYQLASKNPLSLRLSQVYSRVHLPDIPDEFVASEYFPWCEQQLLAGHIVNVSSMQELPEEAKVDRRSWDHYGIKSSLIFPMIAEGGRAIGTISFDMLSHELRWTEEAVQQLQLVARLFANVIHRSQTEQALQESKERYEQLAAYSRTIAWEVDEAGLYTYISPVVEDILGYRPEEIIDKMHFYDLHPEKGRAKFKTEVFAKMQRKEPASEHDNVLVAKDGRFVWVTTNGTPLVNADGSLGGYRGSDKDITKRKKVENDLKLHKADLEEKNKELQKVNIALEVVVESIEQRQKKIENQLLDSVDFVVTPVLSKLRSSGLSCQQKKQVDIIQANLNDVFSPLAHKLNRMMRLLTGTEAQIVGLLKHGLSSKEIAAQLGISTRTVDTHRRNIRKKLGINGKRKDLRRYLLSLDSTEEAETDRVETSLIQKDNAHYRSRPSR